MSTCWRTARKRASLETSRQSPECCSRSDRSRGEENSREQRHRCDGVFHSHPALCSRSFYLSETSSHGWQTVFLVRFFVRVPHVHQPRSDLPLPVHHRREQAVRFQVSCCR